MPIDFSTEGWRVLERWLAEHHPDSAEGDEDELFGIFEAVEAFHRWARTNSIDKYLDANQPVASALSSQKSGGAA
jgi:hypothetical protein